ncbi:hypothetical protein ACLKA6_004546 [Drosophila palustris]
MALNSRTLAVRDRPLRGLRNQSNFLHLHCGTSTDDVRLPGEASINDYSQWTVTPTSKSVLKPAFNNYSNAINTFSIINTFSTINTISTINTADTANTTSTITATNIKQYFSPPHS